MSNCDFIDMNNISNTYGSDSTSDGSTPVAKFEEPPQSDVFQLFIYQSDYDTILPRGLDVFRNIKGQINEISDLVLKAKVQGFVKLLKGSLSSLVESNMYSRTLPAMTLTVEDNLAIFEWGFSYFRLGFIIENDESSWFIVTRNNEQDHTITGPLDTDKSSENMIKILKYVLENS